MWNIFKVNNKDIRTTSLASIFDSLLLTLTTFHTNKCLLGTFALRIRSHSCIKHGSWNKQAIWSPSSKSSRAEGFLGRGVLKIYSKFTGEHPWRSVISIKLLCYFIELALRHGCSSLNLLHIFRTLFPRNTSGWLL